MEIYIYVCIYLLIGALLFLVNNYYEPVLTRGGYIAGLILFSILTPLSFLLTIMTIFENNEWLNEEIK